jgi:hypothetical protein
MIVYQRSVSTACSRRAAIAGVVIALATAVAFAADEMPKRKSGLWEIKMGKGAPTMTQCVDQSRDEALRAAGNEIAQDMKCTMSNVQKGAGTYAFQQTCQMGGSRITSTTRVTGSFDTAYRMESHAKYDPPMMGMSESTTVMEAKWLGACKPGQRPGDMTMPGGMTLNVYDMLDGKKK